MERFYFVGSHGTGKTTMSKAVQKMYGLPLIEELARKELEQKKLTLEGLRADMEAVKRYQTTLWHSQIREESGYESWNQTFISDRSFDNLAYWIEYAFGIGSILKSPEFTSYIGKLKQPNSTVFFVRPEASFIRDDGIRSRLELGMEDVGRIDGIIRAMLEIWDIDYIPIKGTNLKDRLRTVIPIFRHKGFNPKSEI